MRPIVIRNRSSIAIMIVIGIFAIIIATAIALSDKSLGRGIVGLVILYFVQKWIKEFDSKHRYDYKFALPQDFHHLGYLFLANIILAYATIQVVEMIIWIIGQF